MNAIVDIIADGGQAIIVIYREGVKMNYFLLHFIDFAKTVQRRLRPTPCEAAPGGAVFSSEGKMTPSWWGCLCARV